MWSQLGYLLYIYYKVTIDRKTYLSYSLIVVPTIRACLLDQHTLESHAHRPARIEGYDVGIGLLSIAYQDV
jgi:hypothetical protein